jgi:AP-1 complex subunit gamma-1
MSSLKQFIRNVRAAKTIADERAVVQKESAAIRASFREESHDSNVRYAREIRDPRDRRLTHGI